MLLTNWLLSLKHRCPSLRSRRARRRGRRLSRLSSLRRWDSRVQSCAAVELLEDRTLLNGTVTIELVNPPSAVGLGQIVDIGVRVKLTGNTKTGPWQVLELGIYDSDSPTGGYIPWNTIDYDANPFKIYNQNQWYSWTFQNIRLSDYRDTFDFSDGIELYGEVELDDNQLWNGDIQDQTSLKTVLVDDKGPYAPPNIDLSASSDTGFSNTDNITRDTTPTFSWTEPNDRYGSRVVQYRYEVDDSTPDRYTTSSRTITYPSLSDGSHRLYVQAKDQWGNWGDVGKLQFTVDTSAPGTPWIDLRSSSDSGYSSSDNITKDNTPTVDFGASGSPYRFYYDVDDSSPDRGPTGDFSWTTYTLSDGNHRVYVQAEDKAGNKSGVGSLTITIDTSPPGAPTIDLRSSSDTGKSNSDNITKDNTPTVDFSASGSPYRFHYDVDDSSPDRGPTRDSFWTTHSLSNGNRKIYAQAEDKAGNKGGVGSLTITIDATKPSKPSRLTNPANPTADTTPNVTWSPSDGTGSGVWKYEIEWDESLVDPGADYTFWSTNIVLDDSEFTNALASGKSWYWWVRAYDDAGNTSDWAPSLTVGKEITIGGSSVTELSFRNGSQSGSAVIESIYAGDTVYVRADAIGMAGTTIPVEIWEDDGIGDDKVATLQVPIGANGFGTAEWIATWQGNDGDTPDNRYYLFYDVPGSLSDVYSGTANTGHFTVTLPTLTNKIVGTAENEWIEAPEKIIGVSLQRIDSSAPIDNSSGTWVVIHGLRSSFEQTTSNAMWALANAVDAATGTDQVLTLDWREGADAPLGPTDFRGEAWIEPVAQWTRNALGGYGFTSSLISLIGHSWGAVMSAEIASRFTTNVDAIVGLDPAEDAWPVSPILGTTYDTDDVDFSADSNFSWAFLSSQWGSGESVPRAHAAFLMDIEPDNWTLPESHSHVVDAFTEILTRSANGTAGAVSELFDIDNVNAASSIWTNNRFDVNAFLGSYSEGSGSYEGVLHVQGSDGVYGPTSFEYRNSSDVHAEVSEETGQSSTPGKPDLAALSGTGAQANDDLTNLDNSSSQKKLRFLVPGTIAGATVTVYADGTAIGSATATGTTTTVDTDGNHDLSDGPHTIAARQTEPGKSESPDSPALSVTIDTVGPTVYLAKSSWQPDPATFSPINLTATFTESVYDFAAEDIDVTPSGLATTISGGPSVYAVEVVGMTGTGQLQAQVRANSVIDAAGNPNANGSSQVQVAYDIGGDKWVAYTPTAQQTEFNVTPPNPVTVMVTINFPDAGYRVNDWGQVTQ